MKALFKNYWPFVAIAAAIGLGLFIWLMQPAASVKPKGRRWERSQQNAIGELQTQGTQHMAAAARADTAGRQAYTQARTTEEQATHLRTLTHHAPSLRPAADTTAARLQRVLANY